MSLGFGVLAQLIAGKRITRWLWLIASAAAFVGGLLTSEVWFGSPGHERESRPRERPGP